MESAPARASLLPAKAFVELPLLRGGDRREGALRAAEEALASSVLQATRDLGQEALLQAKERPRRGTSVGISPQGLLAACLRRRRRLLPAGLMAGVLEVRTPLLGVSPHLASCFQPGTPEQKPSASTDGAEQVEGLCLGPSPDWPCTVGAAAVTLRGEGAGRVESYP